MAIAGTASPRAQPETAAARTPTKRAPASAAATERRVKLQHFLVMKAFNLRQAAQTVSQQFQFLKQRDGSNQSDRAYMDLDALCAYLSIPPFRRLVLCQVFELASGDSRIDFDTFVRFLQSTAAQAADEEKELRRHHSASSLPVPPPMASPRRRMQPLHGPSALVCFQPTLLSSQTRFSHPPPAPGLWKKREITIQERITEYTKIDELGRPQHLIEKEKHQTEVIHMENIAGEFAHREITQFEQTEQLNDEIVHHEHGREEFVHLKSEHDEISRFESSIPTGGAGNGRPEECEQPPPSPTIKRDPSAMGTAFGSGGDGCSTDDGDDHSNMAAGGSASTAALSEDESEQQHMAADEHCHSNDDASNQPPAFEMESMH